MRGVHEKRASWIEANVFIHAHCRDSCSYPIRDSCSYPIAGRNECMNCVPMHTVNVDDCKHQCPDIRQLLPMTLLCEQPRGRPPHPGEHLQRQENNATRPQHAQESGAAGDDIRPQRRRTCLLGAAEPSDLQDHLIPGLVWINIHRCVQETLRQVYQRLVTG